MAISSCLTDYHAKYYAYELTRRYSADSLEKLASTFAGAKVDLNPHQLDAALFAFESPLSRGALLADEVGLGKTILQRERLRQRGWVGDFPKMGGATTENFSHLAFQLTQAVAAGIE